jgi:DNA recombination protein RmuC
MSDVVALFLGGIALLIAVVGWLRNKPSGGGLTRDQAVELFRGEYDRLRGTTDEQLRGVRSELMESLRGNQESSVRIIGELGAGLKADVAAFGERLDSGVARIEAQAKLIGEKLDNEFEKLAAEATENRDRLRVTIEDRLDKVTKEQADAGVESRTAVLEAVQREGKSIVDLLAQVGEQLKERHEQFASSQSESALDTRTSLLASVQEAGKASTALLGQMGELQKERLDRVSAALAELTTQQGEKLEAIRGAVEQRLDVLRADNSQKLEEMRQTVDEKLKGTLEQRLGESFNRVVEQLERVHAGIGEMRTLATGVGDLKKVLTNVSTRGALGEIQLSRLLEQLLTPDQYIENATIRVDSRERVEFAIRLPGRDGENDVLLPIDAKFPQEDYQRLVDAQDLGDTDAIKQARQALEQRIRQFARAIREKYIAPPRTTDFAILFLPTEGLYAEALRLPGLFEALQREHHITLAGPTTLTALLNALQMGFRSLAIEKRSSEVWKVLSAVRGEFEKYNAAVEGLGKHLGTAANSVKALARRTRVMNKKLKDVETLPAPEAAALLGLSVDLSDDTELEIDERDEEETTA